MKRRSGECSFVGVGILLLPFSFKNIMLKTGSYSYWHAWFGQTALVFLKSFWIRAKMISSGMYVPHFTQKAFVSKWLFTETGISSSRFSSSSWITWKEPICSIVYSFLFVEPEYFTAFNVGSTGSSWTCRPLTYSE